MIWAEEWQQAESEWPMPTRLRFVRTMPWDWFARLVAAQDPERVWEAVHSLHHGDAWLIKGAFPAEWMRELKSRTLAWQQGRAPAFHKMLEGSPDFHRIIDRETGRLYSIEACKHSAYFYRWNDDPLGIWPAIDERWRVVKQAMGLAPDAYEKFTPKDGVVDRIQVVRYPPAIGFLEPHADAWQHQRLFFSGYMGKRGVDYEGGGFYFVDENDRAIDTIEDQIDVGDICIGHANLLHGVAPCDRHKAPDWGKSDGRWFLSLYSNASDEVAKRHTARPVKVSVPGVLPE